MSSEDREIVTIIFENPPGQDSGFTVEERVGDRKVETTYPGPGMMTVIEAAYILGKDRRTIYRWHEAGRLGGRTSGAGLKVFNRDVRRELVMQRRRREKPPAGPWLTG